MGRLYGLLWGYYILQFSRPQTGLSAMGDRLLYALPSEVSGEGSARRKSFTPDDTKLSDLINEELPDSTANGIFYRKLKSAEEMPCGGWGGWGVGGS